MSLHSQSDLTLPYSYFIVLSLLLEAFQSALKVEPVTITRHLYFCITPERLIPRGMKSVNSGQARGGVVQHRGGANGHGVPRKHRRVEGRRGGLGADVGRRMGSGRSGERRGAEFDGHELGGDVAGQRRQARGLGGTSSAEDGAFGG